MNPMTDLWCVFGRDLGQMVEYAYLYDAATDEIIARRVDRSDNSVTYERAPCPPEITWNGSEGCAPWEESGVRLDWKAVTT